jgi:ribosomal protein L1|tara:strand:- start:189 stop:482 length:294 start_codon:yes stop_codon:yes gene_type:complete
MDEEIDMLNIGELPDMDKKVELQMDFTTLIIVCTSMTMYSDHVKEMIDNNVLPSPIGETMLENVEKVITELHHVMAVEGNDLYNALYENVPEGGTLQ